MSSYNLRKTYEHEKGNTKGLETVEESKVEASVDEDAGAGDAKSPVQSNVEN